MNDKNSNDADGRRPETGSARGQGPTTEAGKKKKAEAETAKAEKERRKREKNRKKRKAYREKQRSKNYCWRDRRNDHSSKTAWSKKAAETANGDKKKKTKKNKERRASSKSKSTPKTARDAGTASEPEWENRLRKYLAAGNFEKMVVLFRARLLWTEGPSEEKSGSSIKKRFRALSLRIHPDKQPNAADVSLYKVAFQALNQARTEACAAL